MFLERACQRLADCSRIHNPLADIPQDALFADVEAFCRETGLDDKVGLMQKGALVAQNPGNYENLGLEEDEKEALRIEVQSSTYSVVNRT